MNIIKSIFNKKDISNHLIYNFIIFEKCRKCFNNFNLRIKRCLTSLKKKQNSLILNRSLIMISRKVIKKISNLKILLYVILKNRHRQIRSIIRRKLQDLRTCLKTLAMITSINLAKSASNTIVTIICHSLKTPTF